MSNKNSDDIYFYRELPHVDTSKKFQITIENGWLRVSNKNINCLFNALSPQNFDALYNDFNVHLNVDFSPLILNNESICLTESEQDLLIDTIITRWIYYYTINNLEVEAKRSDFMHPYMVDYVLLIIDKKKYGIDTFESLSLGAKILRQRLVDYTATVKGRRRYYDR